jgi:hypothetical protein
MYLHADDLPSGEAGRDALIERVRQALVKAYDDPAAA